MIFSKVNALKYAVSTYLMLWGNVIVLIVLIVQQNTMIYQPLLQQTLIIMLKTQASP